MVVESICEHCDLNEVGMSCRNTILKNLRNIFTVSLYKINGSFMLFKSDELFLFINFVVT